MKPLVTVIALTAALCGCDSSSKMKALSDNELAAKYGQCLDKQPTAPGRVTACENLRKECDRRREELDIYACRTY